MMKRKITGCLIALTMVVMLVGCGKTKEKNLEGTCEEILQTVYTNAQLDSEVRDAMQRYQNVPIDDMSKEAILGTTDVTFSDSIYSAPMMSSVAYQCVVLRLADGQDVAKAKETLESSADPRKWVCVEAESTVVENVGDVVLVLMADANTADAIKTAFLALGE